MALWLERNLDPALPAEQSAEAFRRAFPLATRAQFEAALDLLIRTTRDRIAAEEADLAAPAASVAGLHRGQPAARRSSDGRDGALRQETHHDRGGVGRLGGRAGRGRVRGVRFAKIAMG